MRLQLIATLRAARVSPILPRPEIKTLNAAAKILPKSFCPDSWIGHAHFHPSKRRRAVSPREDGVSCQSKAASVFLERANQLEDERWKSAYAWFERAMELPVGERLAFAQQAIQDPKVLRLVLDLLESQQRLEESTQR